MDPPQPPSYYYPETASKRRRILHCPGGDRQRTARRNLYRWAKWCADGTAVLAQAEDRSLHVLETPQETADIAGDQETHDDLDSSQDAPPTPWTPTFISRHPTPLVGATWYPSASRDNPSTYCFVTSTRDRPVRLIDAGDGRCRGVYPILHNEQFLAPTCMTFSPDASRLYAGHDSAIDVFDFARPGEGTRFKLSPSRKSKDGQKGIVSAMTFSPDTASGMYAVGTFKGGRVSCYTEDTGEERVMELDVGNGVRTVAGQGITQLAFHPLNPYVLFSASRQSDYISVYDIRNPAYGPYMYLYRPGMTQQRLGFEVDWAGRWLTTGGTDGVLRVYDVNPPVNDKPVMEHDLHSDSIGSVSLHPFKPWVLTAYGSRQPSAFERSLEDDDLTSGDDDSTSEDDGSKSEDDGSDSEHDRSSGSSEEVADGEETMAVPAAALATGALGENDIGSKGNSVVTKGPKLSTDTLSLARARDADVGWIGGLEVSVFH